jgi:Flp pilus assembly protein TadG
LYFLPTRLFQPFNDSLNNRKLHYALLYGHWVLLLGADMHWPSLWKYVDFYELLVRLRDKRGTSAVEFAFLAPLFLLILLGMVAYGIYFGAAHSVQQLAADAARTAVAGIDSTDRQNLVSAFISRNAAGYAFVDPDKLVVEARDSSADGTQFVVSVSYDARNLPIWDLLPDLPMPEVIIARRSTIRIGGL